MTHIRLQHRQQRADVLALSEPEAEIVDRESVTHIVHAGTVTSPAVGDARPPQEPAEVPLDVPHRQRQVGLAGKEPVPTRTPEELGVVVGEPDPERLGDRYQPVFAALGVADLQDAGVDVDIVRGAAAGPRSTARVDRPESTGMTRCRNGTSEQ
jgi:hypothetical protein